jgi:DNA excision repair protein ERCC-3
MVEAGCLPFTSRPVRPEDLRDPRAAIQLRGYQQAAYDKFMQTGAVGVFHPTGAGKSMIAMKISDMIKGPKLIIVPTTTLKDQWDRYLREFLPHIRSEFTIATYRAGKYTYEEWALVIYDECQHLPANTFSGLSLLRTKYRLGLSASPYREDGRENYIIALTGFPVGVNWSEYMQVTGRNFHPIIVHVIKGDWPDKLRLLDTMVDRTKKTLIFSDTIEIGQRIAKRLKIPFIYGDTVNRLDILQKNMVIAISRVGDLGVSIKDLDRVIEVDFQFGSRQQELQRTGRLMHSRSHEPQHDIIMTREELAKYGKRLYALQEKGFRVQVVGSV